MTQDEPNPTDVPEVVRRLHEARELARAVVETVLDAIITIDERGLILTANPSARTLFGYSEAELLGQNVSMLMPSPHKEAHDGYLEHYRRTGERRIIGVGREIMGRRRDGTLVPLELAVSETRVGTRRVFTGVLRDITERREIDRLKNDFISAISHELRTPLASIIGSLGLLQAGVVGPLSPKASEIVQLARRNADRLVSLIDDVLDLDLIASGDLKLKKTESDAHQLLKLAAARHREAAHARGVQLTLHGGPLPLWADPGRLAQVLDHLLSNAIEFSPPDSEVRLTAELRPDDRVRFSVQDRGPGVDETHKERLFERFYQLDSSTRRAKGGAGIGLTLCRGIVEQHGGHIDVRNLTPRGAEFAFEVPRTDASAAQAPAAPPDQPRATPQPGAQPRPARGKKRQDV